MLIRRKSTLSQVCGEVRNPVLADSPEVVLMRALCDGRTADALALFEEQKQFGGPSAVDAPYGRFEGKNAIAGFADGWLATFGATSASVQPVIQTRSGGRSVTEMDINFVVDGQINQVPMFVVGDLRAHHKLDEVRMYCNFSQVPGLTPYRKPIFKPAHLEMGDPALLTGAVKVYYDALHHVPGVDVDRIMRSMGENCLFGGYEPIGVEPHPSDRASLRKTYEHMATYIPKWVGMRYETLIDDGVTCVIEWVHIVTDAGVEEGNRVCLSGIAAYTRGEDGLLSSIRICDYAGYEKQIDWSQTPIGKEEAFSINRVHTFPAGVGSR